MYGNDGTDSPGFDILLSRFSVEDNRPFLVSQLLETGYHTGESGFYFIAGLLLILCQTHLSSRQIKDHTLLCLLVVHNLMVSHSKPIFPGQN